MTYFMEGKQQQELEMQQEQPQSPFPIGFGSGESTFPGVCETPIRVEDERPRSGSPPPIATKAEQRDLATPRASVGAPCGTPPSDAIVTNVNKPFLRRKRQRSRSLPPMIPGSPELYTTPDSNPFGRHVPIHSPIAGIDHTLDLSYVRKLEFSEAKDETQRRQTSDSLRHSTMIKAERRFSIESSDLSYSSDESEGTFGFQTFLPALEDSNHEDAAFGTGKEEHDRIFSSGTRALKMRKRDRNDRNQDGFEPTTYIT